LRWCRSSTGKSLRRDGLRIALDLDGVLADLHSVLLDTFSRFANRRITADMITQWDIVETLKPWLTSSYFNAWDDYGPERITPYELDAGLSVARIREAATVDIVTAHVESSRRSIERWLSLNRIPYDRLVLAGKGSGLHKLSLDGNYEVFIDDNPILAANAPSKVLVILYSQPWNQRVRKLEANSNVTRIRSLRQVPEVLSQLPTWFRKEPKLTHSHGDSKGLS